METTTTKFVQQKQSELFEQLSCFFAFNVKQFNEGIDKFGGIDITGKYVSIGAGLYCPSKNVRALLDGMEGIREQWKKDRKPAEKHQLKFVGIDNWNRPVWKAPDKKEYYGDVCNLFSYEATEEEVREKVTIYDLCYFGDHFGCEPMGTDVPDKYYL